MPGDGSAQLAAVAKELKALGSNNGGLRVELLRGLKEASGPLIVEVKNAARDQLPKGGGLNEQVAGQRVTVSVRTGARSAAVRLTTKAPDTLQTDDGYVRHPTFGRRGKGEWKRQELPNAKGWWSATLVERAPEVTASLLGVMERVAQKLTLYGRR